MILCSRCEEAGELYTVERAPREVEAGHWRLTDPPLHLCKQCYPLVVRVDWTALEAVRTRRLYLTLTDPTVLGGAEFEADYNHAVRAARAARGESTDEGIDEV